MNQHQDYNWKYFGKIAASIALSVIIALFWISNSQKGTKVSSPPDVLHIGKIFKPHLKDRTLVLFWATWCASCKEDLVGLKALKDSELPEGFQILAVNLDEPQNLEEAQFIWSELSPGFNVIYDSDQKIKEIFTPEVLPTYFVFDQTGKTLLRLEGKIKWDDPKVRNLIFEKDL